MSSSHLSRLKNFSGSLSYLSRKYSVNVFLYRRSHYRRHQLLKQQVNANALSNFHRSTHTGYVKVDAVEVSADCDPDLHEFNNTYELVRKAMCHTNDDALIDAVNWSARVLDYNVQGGKKSRGITVLKAFKIFLEEEKISSDKILEACILGWCVELLQGFFLMCDDIMDNSTVRRGKPCWYKVSDVGLIAINDSLLLQFGIFKILKIYFERSEAYNNILHEFLQAAHNTVYGQCLDMLNVPPNTKPRFENFNLEKYRDVVEYKTSNYTFCLPVHLAMHLVGSFSKKEFEDTRNICLKLGLLFQIQDDYLDIFGDSNITGKIGTDIIDGKCTWFSAYFFEHAPESMKKIMIENYGVNTEEAVSKVMEMYAELKLEEKYHECEESFMKEITLMVNNLSRNSLQELFHKLLKKMYKRKK